jgi:hypothetical protein
MLESVDAVLCASKACFATLKVYKGLEARSKKGNN